MAVRSITPSFYVLPPWLGLSWRPLLRAVANPNAVRRDLWLDLLRGFCVLAMILDPIGPSWLDGLTGGNRLLITAAQGFVLLSGLAMGLAYRDRVGRAGLWAAAGSALRRAGTLYLVTVGLTLLFTAAARLTEMEIWADRELAAGEPIRVLVAALTLHYTYHGTDILALYTLLVASGPILFYLLDQRHAAHLVAGSLGLWFGYQLFPEQFLIPWTIRNSDQFPFAAWQMLFVSGLVLGWHRQAATVLAKEHLARMRMAPATFPLAALRWLTAKKRLELRLAPR